MTGTSSRTIGLGPVVGRAARGRVGRPSPPRRSPRRTSASSSARSRSTAPVPEQDAQEVVAARVVGDPAERPHRRRIGRQPVEVVVAHRLVRERDPELALELADDRRVEARPPVSSVVGREARRRPDSRPSASSARARAGVVARHEVGVAPTRGSRAGPSSWRPARPRRRPPGRRSGASRRPRRTPGGRAASSNGGWRVSKP